MRGEFVQLGAVCLGLGVGLAFAAPTARGQAKAPTMPVEEIKDGMKGYGLTVFKGTEPEKFDVEVVGVLHNFRPGQELILVRTPHPRLNITKNVRGMSGSPIYIDGRLVGAYAYSWAAFQAEPVAGVTPIAPMLSEMRRPIPPGFWPLEGGAPLPKAAPPPKKRALIDAPDRFRGEPGEYDLEKHATQMKERMPVAADPSRPLVPASTPLMLGGLGDRTAAYVRKVFGPLGLEPLQAGGGGLAVDPSAPQHYVNGGGLGVSLVRGDVSFFGLGTVTHVEGAKNCGFGHPMMEAGVTALPAAIGRVHWIFASDQHSSKIGESARPLGALVQDRQSAVVVDESKAAPTFPMTVEVKGAVGAPKTRWVTEVAEERFMTPSLVAAVLGSVVEATANERRDVTWKLKTKLTVQGHGTLELEDFGIATGGMPDAGDFGGSRVTRTVGDVLNNPWEHPRIERIESELFVEYARDVVRMRNIELLDPVVDAGGKARVRVHLFSQYGGETSRILEVTLPAQLAGRDVDVEIVPGYDATPDVASPESLNELLANATRSSPQPRGLVTQFKIAQGVAWHGHVAQRLPTFALDTLRPVNGDKGPDAVLSLSRSFVPFDKFVDGRGKVRIKVRPVVR